MRFLKPGHHVSMVLISVNSAWLLECGFFSLKRSCYFFIPLLVILTHPNLLFKISDWHILSPLYIILAPFLRKLSCLQFTRENKELSKIIFYFFFLDVFVLHCLLLIFIFLFLFLCIVWTYVPCWVLSDYFSFFPQD